MAYFLGIDVGSGYSKAVVLEDKKLRSYEVMPSGGDYKEIAAKVAGTALQKIDLTMADVDYTLATGYGATMVDFADSTSTDISCHAAGVYHLSSSVRTVVDIGAQYTSVIRLDSEGSIANLIMN